MSRSLSRQNVNQEVKKWDEVIEDAQALLQKVENRAARLRGAIKTFTELRDLGQPYDGSNAEKAVSHV
jgi:hypothetical protein